MYAEGCVTVNDILNIVSNELEQDADTQAEQEYSKENRAASRTKGLFEKYGSMNENTSNLHNVAEDAVLGKRSSNIDGSSRSPVRKIAPS